MQHLICDVRYICGSFYFDLKTPVMKLTSTIRKDKKERKERCKVLKDQAKKSRQNYDQLHAIRRPSLFQLTSIKRFKCTLLNTHILLMADYDSKPSRWIFTGQRKPPISPPKHNDLYKRRVSSASTLQITSSQTTPPLPLASPLIYYFDLTANETNTLIRAGERRQR